MGAEMALRNYADGAWVGDLFLDDNANQVVLQVTKIGPRYDPANSYAPREVTFVL